MKDEPASRRCRVDVFGQGTETRAMLFDSFYNIEQIAQGSSQAVILGDDDHITRAEVIKQLGKLWPVARRSRDFSRKNALCTGRLKSVGLGI